MSHRSARIWSRLLLATLALGAPVLQAQTSPAAPRAAANPSPADGFWLGTLTVAAQRLRVQVTLKTDASGHESCTADSLDQGAFGLPCANVAHAGEDLSFDVPAVKGHWVGKLSADGNALAGTWTQGEAWPLDFTRQVKPQTPPPRPPASFDPAMAPVDSESLQQVLDRDLAQALKDGALAPQTFTGVAIGVSSHGVRRVFAYGTAKRDSLFEIGSITKTFTGLVLAQMIVQGRVRLDTPVRELLPGGLVPKPGDREIVLLDLVTHHSGLPRMPDNFNPADPDNPYADYSAADLYQFIARHGVARPADAPFLYSNLGVGLLGQALGNRAGIPYAQLLKDEVTTPLGLTDTVISLQPARQGRFIEGHTPDHQVAHAWDFDALAGAGAVRSTADDLLTYLEANLHPDRLRLGGAANADARTLPQAIVLSHEMRDGAGPGMHIALAWMHDDTNGSFWHDGATGGYTSQVIFNPREDYAVVVLVNTALGKDSNLAAKLGRHIAERLEGKPAVSLGNR